MTDVPRPQTAPTAAIEQLTNHQEQADMGGERVTVSRQALDEVLTYLREKVTPGVVEALRTVERALQVGQPAITCTVWVPDSPAETLLDHVQAALEDYDAGAPMDAKETFRQLMVDVARARGGAGADFIARGESNLWLDIAFEAAVLAAVSK